MRLFGAGFKLLTNLFQSFWLTGKEYNHFCSGWVYAAVVMGQSKVVTVVLSEYVFAFDIEIQNESIFGFLSLTPFSLELQALLMNQLTVKVC